MKIRSWFVGALGVVLATSISVQPALAEESLDTLKATDADLTKAIDELTAQVKQEQADVDSAQQSVSAAEDTVTRTQAAVGDTEAKIEELRDAAAKRAVEEYMQPSTGDLGSVLKAEDMLDASRRTALLQEVDGRGRDAIDQLGAAKADLESQKTAALAARAIADQRRATSQQKLDELNASLAEKQRLDVDLQNRIDTAAAEDSTPLSSTVSAQERANRGGESGDTSRISASGMVLPSNGPIRSPFGQRWGRNHNGIDFGASNGDPIYAAKAGTVTSASWDGGGYGNLTEIDHGGGVSTWYAHQSRFAVSAGDTVSAGQLIGYAGFTGSVVPQGPGGAHLHFEVHINGNPVNPAQYLP